MVSQNAVCHVNTVHVILPHLPSVGACTSTLWREGRREGGCEGGGGWEGRRGGNGEGIEAYHNSIGTIAMVTTANCTLTVLCTVLGNIGII